MTTETSQSPAADWRIRKPPLHWRVSIPIADAAEVLGVAPAMVEALVARDEVPALLTGGWLLISYPALIDPDRSPLVARLQHAWSQVIEWEGDITADRFPNRVVRQPEDCSCDGCLTHNRRLRQQR